MIELRRAEPGFEGTGIGKAGDAGGGGGARRAETGVAPSAVTGRSESRAAGHVASGTGSARCFGGLVQPLAILQIRLGHREEFVVAGGAIALGKLDVFGMVEAGGS